MSEQNKLHNQIQADFSVCRSLQYTPFYISSLYFTGTDACRFHILSDGLQNDPGWFGLGGQLLKLCNSCVTRQIVVALESCEYSNQALGANIRQMYVT